MAKQIGEDQTVTLAGCGDSASVQVQWPNIEPGNYQVYVQVDPFGHNKIIDQRIGFATEQVFTPLS